MYENAQRTTRLLLEYMIYRVYAMPIPRINTTSKYEGTEELLRLPRYAIPFFPQRNQFCPSQNQARLLRIYKLKSIELQTDLCKRKSEQKAMKAKAYKSRFYIIGCEKRMNGQISKMFTARRLSNAAGTDGNHLGRTRRGMQETLEARPSRFHHRLGCAMPLG